MAKNAPWSFYGRRSELQQMQRILERRRWFFLQISGRRRIGKTALIQEALQRPVSAVAFRPVDALIAQADERLADVEGYALEDLAGQLYEERSRLGIGDFPLSGRIRGYRDRADVEIDVVAVNEDERRIRFGTCKRNAERLPAATDALKRSAGRFLDAHARFGDWQAEYVAIAPDISDELKGALRARGILPQSLRLLTQGL